MNLLRLLLLLGLCLPAATVATADEVRVYRCVSSTGSVSLQDRPCSQGRQEVRDLQRPRDPAPRGVRSDAPPADAAAPRPEREVRHVFVQPPQPMYECISQDGDRYVSDSNEGNPRWVPLWATAWAPHRRPWDGRGGGIAPVRPAEVAGAEPLRGPGGYPHPPSVGVGVSLPAGSILVRDTCHALPQQEVCARLDDRRWELDRRYNSALQSERTAITREQRSIDARIAQDCGRR
ncbi:DUF4124 domain-containing protein [Stenotrophomonas sp. 24(2023)]|uniref:DUF4124 domain-containing protein n=1 Tax=Stenotrophomonas sp. 24(2023) TaxID=3068324 RepID=UPI0027DF9BCD|nr:DUF4124 domain-containing protein [Stenotrophomonas sp. 24(2023)]WMJ70663.1 DUF4124 domain-containing protein [Stenotrophomonas sp. 24(2023)]